MRCELGGLVRKILKGYRLDPWGIHGVVHWARVLEKGLRVAEHSGADAKVVMYFALFHDSRRENDGTDPEHGPRGGELAREFYAAGKLDLSPAQLELLVRACDLHTDALSDQNVTVHTCFDADRLDLGRVGMTPNPYYLSTDHAKDPATIRWADRRACADFEPERLQSWGVPRD
jgi:uncharacterized protein